MTTETVKCLFCHGSHEVYVTLAPPLGKMIACPEVELPENYVLNMSAFQRRLATDVKPGVRHHGDGPTNG